MKKVLLGTVFGLAGLLMSVSTWADQTEMSRDQCGTKPSCAAMGFVYSADECKGYFALRCPWDASKVACDCTFKYRKGASNGNIASPSCKRLGVTYYRDSCSGVLESECLSVSGDSICTDTMGNEYYAGCSNEKNCEVGDLLYSNSDGDRKCFSGVAMSRTVEVDEVDVNYDAIGVVFDTTNHLAIALDENRGEAVTSAYGQCDICGLNSSLGLTGTRIIEDYNCYKGVAFYNHCKLDDDREKMNVILYDGNSIAGVDSNENIDAYNATLSVLSNTSGTSSSLGETELLASFPAIKYCYDYSRTGTQSGISVNNENIGDWVLPTTRDWATLNSNFELVNNKLTAVARSALLNNIVEPIAGVDSVYSDGKRITSDPKYWTSNLKGGTTVWETKHGFKRYKYSYIFDFEAGASYPVPSTKHSVRARCMIKYAD